MTPAPPKSPLNKSEGGSALMFLLLSHIQFSVFYSSFASVSLTCRVVGSIECNPVVWQEKHEVGSPTSDFFGVWAAASKTFCSCAIMSSCGHCAHTQTWMTPSGPAHLLMGLFVLLAFFSPKILWQSSRQHYLPLTKGVFLECRKGDCAG